jgi:ribosome recycling factor
MKGNLNFLSINSIQKQMRNIMFLNDLKLAIKEGVREANEEMRLEFVEKVLSESKVRDHRSAEYQKQVQKIIDEFLARIEKINPTT